MTRLFIAIDFPQEIKGMLARLCLGLPGARWTPEDQLHLTLRFIGEVDGGVFLDIREALHSLKASPLELTLKGVGFFPPRKQPRILWVGIDKNDPLQLLKKRLDSTLSPLGLEPEKRKFSPHITLARLKNTPLTRLTQYLAGNNLFCTPAVAIRQFQLYSSVLTAKGAVHELQATYELG